MTEESNTSIMIKEKMIQEEKEKIDKFNSKANKIIEDIENKDISDKIKKLFSDYNKGINEILDNPTNVNDYINNYTTIINELEEIKTQIKTQKKIKIKIKELINIVEGIHNSFLRIIIKIVKPKEYIELINEINKKRFEKELPELQELEKIEELPREALEHVEEEGLRIIGNIENESPTLGSRLKKFFMSYLKLDVTKIEELHNLIINIIPKSRNKRIAALLISLATLIGGLVTIIKLTEYYTVKPKHKYAIKNGKLVKR